MISIREQILAAIESRLAVIRTANGYRTNIGAHVHFATKDVDPDDELPGVALWPEPETSEKFNQSLQVSMTVGVEGMVPMGASDHPARVAEAILPDIVEAMTAREWVYEFSDGTVEPAPGAALTGDISGRAATLAGVSLTSGAWDDGDAAGLLTVRGHHAEFVDETLSTPALFGFALVNPDERYGISLETLVTGGLADEILYTEGGTDSWPEAGDSVAASRAEFSIRYRVRRGDPYRQP